MTRIGKQKVRAAVCVFALFAATACTRLEDSHGYVPSDDLLDEVVVGVDTKETAGRILGRPGTAGLVDDRGWYYVKSDYERFLWRAPVEVNREVVAVSFAENGQVENIERFGLEDGQVVQLSRRVTDSSVANTAFLRQLLGNIGQFTPGGIQ